MLIGCRVTAAQLARTAAAAVRWASASTSSPKSTCTPPPVVRLHMHSLSAAQRSSLSSAASAGGGGSGGSGTCWKCSQPLPPRALFCEQCSAVQALDAAQVSHFDLLLGAGEAPTYRVDAGRLASAMRRLQWQLHPDKFVQASEHERNLAQQQSARVNAAYKCLTDPVRRAVYLLSLRGVAMPTEETGGGRTATSSGDGDGDGDLSLPQEFLAEMLELNEALMEADSAAVVAQLSERVERDAASVTRDLAEAFDSGHLELAKELTYRLRYFANIRAKIREMS